jgi:hypothetical protein
MTKPLLFALCLLLAGCPAGAPPEAGADPQATPPAKVAEGLEEMVSPPPPASPAPALPAAEPAPVEPAPAGDPSAARRPPEELLTQDGVYYGCKTNLDCEVKNVGNCCGYYPACVNKDSPTFPERVKAACAASGSSSVCGFPEIAGCQCVEGRCAPLGGPASGALQQE